MNHTRVLDANEITERLYAKSARALSDAAVARPLVERAFADGNAILGQGHRTYALLVPLGEGRVDAYLGVEEADRYSSSDRVRPVAAESVTVDSACAMVGRYLGNRDTITLIRVTEVEKHYLRR